MREPNRGGRGKCMKILIPLNYGKCIKQTKLLFPNVEYWLQSDL